MDTGMCKVYKSTEKGYPAIPSLCCKALTKMTPPSQQFPDLQKGCQTDWMRHGTT